MMGYDALFCVCVCVCVCACVLSVFVDIMFELGNCHLFVVPPFTKIVQRIHYQTCLALLFLLLWML